MIPPIGSPEFCACLGQLAGWMEDFWDKWGDIVTKSIPGVELTMGIVSDMFKDLVQGGPVGVLKSLWSLTSTATDVLLIFRMTEGVANIVNQMNLPNRNAIMGTQLAKGFIASLADFTVHTEGGLGMSMKVGYNFTFVITILDHLLSWLWQGEMPTSPEAAECYLKGTITREQYECWLKLNGLDPKTYQPVLESKKERLTPPELIQYLRRIGMPDDFIATQLVRRNAFADVDAAGAVLNYDELPSVSDFLHWLQRNVFNDEYVQDYGLLDGFEDRFWAKFGQDLHALGVKKEYAELHYAAHWLNPSPGQLRDFVFRLRPGRDPDGWTFTADDYKRILAEQDVAPYFQDRFAATIYNLAPAGTLRDLFRLGKISRDELVAGYQDLGYSPATAEQFAAADDITRVRQRRSQYGGWTARNVVRAVVLGQMDYQIGLNHFFNLDYDQEEYDDALQAGRAALQERIYTRALSRQVSAVVGQIRAAQTAGVLDPDSAAGSLAQLGFPAPQAAAIAQATDAAMRTGLVVKAKARLRSAYLAGEIDEQFATIQLGNLGVTASSIALELAEWRIARTPNRKRRTAAQYISDLTSGLLHESEVRARLTNLGYESSDIDLFIAQARLKQTKQQQQLQQKADKANAKRAKSGAGTTSGGATGVGAGSGGGTGSGP